jgi:hypothetical protein
LLGPEGREVYAERPKGVEVSPTEVGPHIKGSISLWLTTKKGLLLQTFFVGSGRPRSLSRVMRLWRIYRGKPD